MTAISTEMTAYCVKCKSTSETKGGYKEVKTKNGRSMLQGHCKKCNTKMSKFVGKTV